MLDPTFSGDSVGKWQGDTLVLDTIGFNDRTWLDAVGLPHSDKMHVAFANVQQLGQNRQ